MSGFEITFMRPYWLLALPLVAMAGWWAWSRAGGAGGWDRATDPALMRAMAAMGRLDDGKAGKTPLIALIAALLISVIALSGPAAERRDAQSFRNLDAAIFVVEASPELLSDPRWPQMLTMGRFGVSALGSRPGALILYAGDAYTATDLTADTQELGQSLSLLAPGLIPDKGLRPERALDLAAKLMAEADIISGDVLLFTGGEGLGPASLRATEALTAKNARLSVIALTEPSPLITAHAGAGGGRVFTLSETTEFSAWLADGGRIRLEHIDYPVLFWRDYGRWLLALTLLPLLLLFQREGA